MLEIAPEETNSLNDYVHALALLRELPDHCATDLDDLALQVGAEKLKLIEWGRADLRLARLIDAKVTK